jgi:hypothetical protein
LPCRLVKSHGAARDKSSNENVPDHYTSREYKDSEREVHYHGDRLAEHQHAPFVVPVCYNTGKKPEKKLGNHSYCYYKSDLKGGAGQLEDKEGAHYLFHPHRCRMTELSQPHITEIGIAESPEGAGYFYTLAKVSCPYVIG